MKNEIRKLKYEIVRLQMGMLFLSMVIIAFSFYVAVDCGMNFFHALFFIAIIGACAVYRYLKLYKLSKRLVRLNEKISKKNKEDNIYRI